MCLIIDACVRDQVFAEVPHSDAVPVLDWIEKGDGRVAYGGRKLCDELFKSRHATRRIKAWKQAGRATEIPQAIVDAEETRVNAMDTLKSDDAHVIALARISGARTLYSNDEDLHADFKNATLINDPRGAIYKSAEHAPLLNHTSSCRAAAASIARGLFSR